MAEGPEHGGRRGVLLAAAVTAVLAVLGCTLLALGATSGSELTVTSGGAAESTSPTRPEGRRTTDDPARDDRTRPARTSRQRQFLPGSPPVALNIPAIDVRSSTIVDLGLQEDGSIEVPRNADHPGWFSPGPSPGQFGPAVIAGHVDSETGPAVFYRLAELRAGDRVEVVRADGTTARFVIDRVATFEKDEFPTREVYGAIDHAGLRLITCSGDYDEQRGYDSNTIAFARLLV